MDAAEREHIVERLRGEILSPRIDGFRAVAESLRGEPLDAFHEAFTPLFQEARAVFRELIEVPTALNIPPDINQLFFAYTISDFNSALPPDYPYILAIANVSEERRFCCICIERKWVSKVFPEAPSGAVAVVFVETTEDLAKGNIFAMDIAYSPADVHIVPPD